MKTITILNPANLPTISFKELKAKYEPNALKRKQDRDVGGLKASILALGFSIPLFVWEKGKYIVDGAGRYIALELLEYEGYTIPDIPYVPIEAKNKQEAKRLTLAISSQYGLVSPDSIGEFTLDLKEIDLSFINIEGYNLDAIDWKPPQAKEIDMGKMKADGASKIKHTCPKCSFEWTS